MAETSVSEQEEVVTEDNETSVIEDETTPPPSENVSESAASIMSTMDSDVEPMAITEHKVTYTVSEDYTVAFTAGVDTESDNAIKSDAGTSGIGFTVTPAAGKTVSAVSWKIGEGSDAPLTGTAVDGTDAKSYTIEGSSLTEAAVTGDIVLTITVASKTYTVSVTKSAEGLKKATYTTDGSDPTADSTALNGAIENIEHGTNLKLYVEPADNYTVTVKKDGATIDPANNVYDLDKITAATTVAVEAEKSSYALTFKAENETGSTGDITAVKAVWGDTAVKKVDNGTETWSIAKDKDLTFTVAGLNDDTQRLVSVYYGTDSAQNNELTEEDDVYTITADQIKTNGDVTVKIVMRDRGKSTVKYETNPKVSKVTYKAEGGAYEELNNTNGVEVKEDETFSFKIETVKGFKVKAVTAKDAGEKAVTVSTATEGEDTVYTLTGTTKDITLTIETEPDEDASYILVLEMADGSDAGSATAVVTDGDEENADDDALNVSMSTAKDGTVKIVTLNPVVQAVVTADANHELSAEGSVTLKGTVEGQNLEPVTGEDVAAGTYKITLAEGKPVTLVVKTQRKALETAKTVTFNNSASHIELAVDEQIEGEGEDAKKIVYQDEENKNKYHLAAAGEGMPGAREITFTLTVDGPYVPAVKRGADGNTVVDMDQCTENADGTVTYAYTLLAAALENDDTVNITETADQKTVQIQYNQTEDLEEVSVSAKLDAKEIAPNALANFEAAKGAKLTVSITALDHSAITGVKAAMGNEEAAAVTGFDAAKNAQSFTFTMPVTEDTVITVESASKEWQAALTDAEDEALTPAKGVYSVQYDGVYKAAVNVGAEKNSKLLALSKADILETVNKKEVPVKEKEGFEDSWSSEFDGGKTCATVTLTEKLAGKNCVLVLYAKKDDVEYEAARYKLSVSKTFVGKDIKVNKGKPITQPVDTKFYGYEISATKGADLDMLQWESSNTEIVKKADIYSDAKGKKWLAIETGFTKGDATLKPYLSEGAAKKYIQVPDGSNGTKDLAITVTAGDLFIAEGRSASKVDVKALSATDVTLTLQLSTKAVRATEVGSAYYEVKAVPKNYDASKHSGLKSDETIKYVMVTPDQNNQVGKTNAVTDTVTLVVGSSDTLGSSNSQIPCNYEISARLVHVKQALAEGATDVAQDNLQSAGAVTKKEGKDFATKVPAYETSLKVKKGTTTIYTGQKNATAATAVFSKDTSFRELYCATDITAGVTEDNGALKATVNGDKVIIDASGAPKLGKHKIEVIALGNQTQSDDGTVYASRTTFDVTVVKGIDEIELNALPASLYKAPKKTATFKASVTFNKTSAVAPKSKKVKWSLSADGNGTDANMSLTLAGGTVKIDKNGKITVDKNYTVTGAPKENQFYVIAKADDFPNNDTASAISEAVTITNDMLTLGGVFIRSESASQGGSYANLTAQATSKNGIEADALNGTYLVAVADGFPNRGSYEEAVIEKYAITDNIAFKSSNAKAVSINEEGQISVKAPAKNVKLTVSTTDGGKAKNLTEKTLAVNVVYNTTGKLGLEIEKVSENTNKPWIFYDVPEDGKVTFNDSAAAVFDLKVQQFDTEDQSEGEEGTWVDVNPLYTNYKISAGKGAKLLWEDKEAGTARIVVTAKEATVKITNNALRSNKDTVYTFTNTGLGAATAKAPKVTLSYVGKTKAIKAVCNEQQLVRLTIAANGNKYPLDLTREDLYVQVEPDWSTVSAKNKAAVNALAASMWPNGYTKLSEYGGNIDFNPDNSNGEPLFNVPAGSYKLKVTVGTVGADRAFIPAAQPATVTLKIAKDKALSFKPNTSYKISAKDGGKVTLSGKGTADKVSFTKLLNDNVSGKTKGKENAFTDWFELDADKKTLKIKSSKIVNGELLGTIPAEDLSGYVFYEAGYSHTGETVTGSAKIKVSLADTIRKYAVSNASIFNEAGKQTYLTVTADKKPISVSYAIIDTTGRNHSVETDWSLEGTTNGKYDSATEKMTLKMVKAQTGKNVKVDLIVIPADSIYADKVRTDNAENTKADIARYGVKLTTTVTLSEETTANKRISFKSLKYKFSKKHLGTWDDAASKWSDFDNGYYAPDDTYCIDIPFTELYDGAKGQIKSIETEVKGTATADLVHFSVGDSGNTSVNQPYLSISMSRSDLMAKVKADEAAFYKRDKKKGTVTPKELTFTAVVKYGDAANAPVDKFAFKLTMPEYKAPAAEGKTDFEEAVAYLKSEEGKAAVVAETVRRNHEWCGDFKYYKDEETKTEWTEATVKEAVKDNLYGALEDVLGLDCGIFFSDEAPTFGNESCTMPTSSTKGSYGCKVSLTDGKESAKTDEVSFTIELKALGTKASDVKDTVKAFMQGYGEKASNKTTKASFLADLYDYVKENASFDVSDIRFAIERAENSSNMAWELDRATTGKAGSLKVTVKIYDLAYNGTEAENEVYVSSEGESITIAIEQLLPETAVIDKIKDAVGISGDNADANLAKLIASNNEAKAKAAVLEAAEKAIGKNPYEVAFEADTEETKGWEFKPAEKEAPGKIAFTLIVTKEGETLAGDAGKLSLPADKQTIAAISTLMTAADAKTAIETWIRDNTLGAGEDASDSSVTKVLKNGVSARGILTAITNASNGVVKENSLVTVSFAKKAGTDEDDLTVTAATLDAKGSVKGTLVVTDCADKTETVAIDVEIPDLPQDVATAITKIQAEVKKDNNIKTYGITADTADGDETVTTAIVNVAKNAEGMKKNAFTISPATADDKKLKVEATTDTTKLTVKITLMVKATGTDGDGTACDITFDISVETPAPAPEEPAPES